MAFIPRQFFFITLLALTGFACFASPIVGKNTSLANVPPVIIDYFFEAGCADCYRVKNQIMPELKERCEGFYKINNHDVGIKTNVIRLAAYQEKLKIVANKPVMMVVDYKYVFNGFDAIKSELLRQVDECFAERQEPGWNPPQPVEIKDEGILKDRVNKFTASIVVTAGFLDGLNPCAIATLVFLMSLMAVSKVKGRGLLLMGISFCLASFVTYTALGFGLLKTLYLFSGFPLMRQIVDVGMLILLSVFALISFIDAYRYKKTGNPDDVTLQLPGKIKLRIHKILRRETEFRSQNSEDRIEGGEGKEDFGQNLQNEQNEEIALGRIVVGGAIIGVLVTALESVCTGQMYGPTLVVLAKSQFDGLMAGGKAVSKVWAYLLLYNLMFIVPLVTVFILTYFGLRTPTLLDWSRKNVVISKVLMGIFFVMMAVLVWVL